MKISELQMDTHRLDEMYVFYATTLGFDVLDVGNDFFAVQIGFTRLTFRRTNSDVTSFYHYAFNVPSVLVSSHFLKDNYSIFLPVNPVCP